jgi:hypothetical protein
MTVRLIKIKNPNLQKYILNNLRDNITTYLTLIDKDGKYEIGDIITVKVGDKRLQGEVITTELITTQTLNHYVKFSGFNDTNKWLKESEKHHKTRIDPNKFVIILFELVKGKIKRHGLIEPEDEKEKELEKIEEEVERICEKVGYDNYPTELCNDNLDDEEYEEQIIEEEQFDNEQEDENEAL